MKNKTRDMRHELATAAFVVYTIVGACVGIGIGASVSVGVNVGVGIAILISTLNSNKRRDVTQQLVTAPTILMSHCSQFGAGPHIANLCGGESHTSFHL